MLFRKATPLPLHGHIVLGGTPVPYTLQRSAQRRRSISYRVVPREGIVLRAPIRASTSMCLDILERRAAWILKHFCKPPPAPKLAFRHGSVLPFVEGPLQLQVIKTQKPARVVRKGDILEIHTRRGPVAPIVTAWIKAQAIHYFETRVAHWAKVMNLSYTSIRIGSAARRWGSCSAANRLMFTWRLMLTPPHLIDYVIVHELAHVPHKNHGPRFWALVEHTLPDFKTRKKELNLLGGQLP
ncbi:MAG: SprT family zinc-dependent metalloprotease [Alphaproteobacteria bacterium]